MNSLAGGGMERAMLNLASFFVAQGASVDLLVASAKGPLLTEVPDSVNLIDLKSTKSRLESVRWWFLKAALKMELLFLVLLFLKKLPKAVSVIPGLVNYIKCSSPDMIFSTPTTANLAAIWAKSYCGYSKKIVVREATTLSKEVASKRTTFFRLIRIFVKKWYRYADVVVCVSDGVSRDLSKNFAVNKQQIRTIFNIIDIEQIMKKSVSSEHDFMISRYGDYILSAGRLEKEKDYETLIRAFHLISKNVSVNLVILGEGSERKKLMKLIEELSLSERVFLPGFKANPYPFISKCDVFALSSRWEGCPNVLREALILNKKIISTDCESGVRDILGCEEFGSIVPIGDVEEYSVKLKFLLESIESNHGLRVIELNSVSEKAYYNLMQECG